MKSSCAFGNNTGKGKPCSYGAFVLFSQRSQPEALAVLDG